LGGSDHAFDNITGTKWLDPTTNYPSTRQSWIQYQYADGVRWAVSEYTVTSANDCRHLLGAQPRRLAAAGANDGGTSWATLDVQTNQAFTANYQKLHFPSPTPPATTSTSFALTAWPILLRPAACQLDELEFWPFHRPTRIGGRSAMEPPPRPRTRNIPTPITEPTQSFLSSQTFVGGNERGAREVASPSLTVLPGLPGTLGLAWPSWAMAYNLYASTKLTPPATWLPVTNAVNTLNGTNIVTVSIDTGSRFFQLRR